MGLSNTLKNVIDNSNELAVIYDQFFFRKVLDNNPEFRNNVLSYTRTSHLTGWKRLTLNRIIEAINGTYQVSIKKGKIKIITNIQAYDGTTSIGREKNNTKHPSKNEVRMIIENITKSQALECFVSGSQIHQNAISLYYLGMPIIKLDLLYRGMFNYEDVNRLLELMPEAERKQVLRILLSRPYGGDVFFGWQRYAFLRGLL